MDTAVGDELLQRQSRHLAANGIEARNGDDLGGIVDDQLDTRQGLQLLDVPALAADDASLHLLAGQRHRGNGGLGYEVARASLNGQCHDAAGLIVGLLTVLLLQLHNALCLLVADLLLQLGDQLCLSLLGGIARDLFQHELLLVQSGVDLLADCVAFLELLVQLLVLLVQLLALLIQILFLLGKTGLGTGHLGAALLDLLLHVVLLAHDLFLGGEKCFLLQRLGLLGAFLDQLLGLLLGGTDLGLGHVLAVENTHQSAHGQANNAYDDGNQNFNRTHV